MSTFARYALAYAARGLRVFPCRGKVPLTPHGCRDATADPEAVRRLWERSPEANVAIATGAGLAVLDVDGEAGAASLARLAVEHGPITTATSKTWSGYHLWFQVPEDITIGNSAGRVGEGLDVRGCGGFVIAPPSVHPSGIRYAWVVREPLAPMPQWLIELTRKPEPVRAEITPRRLEPGQDGTPYGFAALKLETEAVRCAPEGRRNDSLNRAAFACGQLVGGGELTRSVVEDELTIAALDAGLGTVEAARTITSGLNAGTAHPRGAAA